MGIVMSQGDIRITQLRFEKGRNLAYNGESGTKERLRDIWSNQQDIEANWKQVKKQNTN